MTTVKNHLKINIFNTLLILSIIITTIYSNSFLVSWHLDDEPNIVENAKIQIDHLTLGAIADSFHAHPTSAGQLYRPVAMLTFALNWWIGKDAVIGYHIVNILIHMACAFLLFLTIIIFFQTPNIKGRYTVDPYFIALLSAVLWSVHPIQTQAVTYIVQRMASLCTLFFLLSLYLYVRGRITVHFRQAPWCYLGCCLSYLLAMGSKENAAIFPLSLLIVEAIFFQNLSNDKTPKRFGGICLGFVLILVIACVAWFIGDYASLLNGYKNRSFTLAQRLMTEPRVLLFYLSQIFYPVVGRLSIEHDIVVSTSIFMPWQTFPSILLIGALLCGALLGIKRYPFLAFAVLFYFLNHSVESTVVPLELIFEHRNYLPSLFLFVPISIGLFRILASYQKRNRAMAVILSFFIMLLVVLMGVGTYHRNTAWATDLTLWLDAAAKAPHSARPLYWLAKYYAKHGAYDHAMDLYQKVYDYQSATPDYTRALALNGMAAIYFAKQDYEKSIAACRDALDLKPDFDAIRYNMAIAQIKSGYSEAANQNLDILIGKQPHSSLYNYYKGVVYFRQNDLNSALAYFRKALRLEPGAKAAKLQINETLAALGAYQQAELFVKVSQPDFASDAETLAFLFTNSIRLNQRHKAELYLSHLIDLKNPKASMLKLEQKISSYLSLPEQKKAAIELVKRQFEIHSRQFMAIH